MRSSLLIVLALVIAGHTPEAAADGQSDLDACIHASNRNNYDMVIMLCGRAERSGELSNEDTAAALHMRGGAYFYAGEYERAILDYDQAIRLEPGNPKFYFSRGFTYVRKGEFDRAIQDYDQTVRLNPEDAEIYIFRGSAYDDRGDYNRAIQDYDQAIRINPDDAKPYNYRATAYAKKGEYDRAFQDYGRAIRLDPGYALAHRNRGYTYHVQGAYDLAIADYDRAIKLTPDDHQAYYNRGFVHEESGDYALALADWTKVEQIKPEVEAEIAWDRGRALFELGRFPEAVEALSKSVKAEPRNTSAALWLHLARGRAGNGGAEQLRTDAKQLDLGTWPGPIVRYYLGAVSEGEVLDATIDTVDAGERRCQAAFYLGEIDLLAGRMLEAEVHFERAVEVCPRGRIELSAAKAELARM